MKNIKERDTINVNLKKLYYNHNLMKETHSYKIEINQKSPVKFGCHSNKVSLIIEMQQNLIILIEDFARLCLADIAWFSYDPELPRTIPNYPEQSPQTLFRIVWAFC